MSDFKIAQTSNVYEINKQEPIKKEVQKQDSLTTEKIPEHKTEEKVNIEPLKMGKSATQVEIHSNIAEKALIVSGSAIAVAGTSVAVAKGFKDANLVTEGLKTINASTASLKDLKDVPVQITRVEKSIYSGTGIMIDLNNKNIPAIEKGIANAKEAIFKSNMAMNPTFKAIDLAKSQINFTKGGIYALGAGVALATVVGVASVDKTENKVAIAVGGTSVLTGGALAMAGTKYTEAGIEVVKKGSSFVKGGVASITKGILLAESSVINTKVLTETFKTLNITGSIHADVSKPTSTIDKLVKGQNVVTRELNVISKGDAMTAKGLSLVSKGSKLFSTGAKVGIIGVAVATTIGVGAYVYTKAKN